jgi:hypothetical protein
MIARTIISCIIWVFLLGFLQGQGIIDRLAPPPDQYPLGGLPKVAYIISNETSLNYRVPKTDEVFGIEYPGDNYDLALSGEFVSPVNEVIPAHTSRTFIIPLHVHVDSTGRVYIKFKDRLSQKWLITIQDGQVVACNQHDFSETNLHWYDIIYHWYSYSVSSVLGFIMGAFEVVLVVVALRLVLRLVFSHSKFRANR